MPSKMKTISLPTGHLSNSLHHLFNVASRPAIVAALLAAAVGYIEGLRRIWEISSLTIDRALSSVPVGSLYSFLARRWRCLECSEGSIQERKNSLRLITAFFSCLWWLLSETYVPYVPRIAPMPRRRRSAAVRAKQYKQECQSCQTLCP